MRTHEKKRSMQTDVLIKIVVTCFSLALVGKLEAAAPGENAPGRPNGKQVQPHKEIVAIDKIMVEFEKIISDVKPTDTDIVKDEVYNRATNELQDNLARHRIAVTVHIGNVRMDKPNVATLSLHHAVTPELSKISQAHVSVSPSGSVNLPMSKEQAMAIKPGQLLTLIGDAVFEGRKDLFAYMFPSNKYEIRLGFSDFPFKNSSRIVLTPSLYSISPGQQDQPSK